MSGFPRIAAYAVGLIGLFTGFSYWGIPPVVPEPPPAEEKVTASMTVEAFVGVGARIYNRACVLCHSGLGDRAPKLDAIATTWRGRLGDPRYRGSAKTLDEYLRESMLQPSAYVVKGFGKPGTNDTESPMPEADRGALALAPAEIDAVIAYLQSAAGVAVTVTPSAGGATPAASQAGDAALAEKAPDAVSALVKFQCNVCHHLPGLPAEADAQPAGPDLRETWKTAAARAPGMDAKRFVAESILFPNKVLAEGFEAGLMPEDFADRMLVAELQMIVDHLAEER